MRLGDGPSNNFEDRTGQGGGGLGFGGGGGNMLGCLLPLIASRFGVVGVVILLLGYCALTQLGGGGGGLLPSSQQQSSAPSGQSTLSADNRRLLTGVLESTDSIWTKLFAANGSRYVEPTLTAYTRGTQTACGLGQAAMGPFYCPNDQHIYIDPEFFDELSRRFGAPGDFAQAYVIAHEVGHHVQKLTGQLDDAQRSQQSLGEAGANQVQVGVELQADCYAGVWAANAKAPDGTAALEPGDVEEGMRAAEAIGDDTLQRQSQGVVVPESFTHGTSAQRMAALRTGLQSGDPSACHFNQ
jgi:predicted metalloprotease